MFCPNCGAQIPDDSIFCEKCGSRINEEAPALQDAEETVSAGTDSGDIAAFSRERKSSGSRTVLYIAIGAVVLAIACAGFLFFRKGQQDGGKADSKPTETVSESVSQSSGQSDIPESTGEKEDAAGSTGSTENQAETGAETDQTAVAETQNPDKPDMMEADLLQGVEETAGTVPGPDEMAELAEKFSTTENAAEMDFEWATDYILHGGKGAGRVIADPSEVTHMTGDMQPLLNGGWKAFMFTKTGDYGSDTERYFHAEINTSGDSFRVNVNWNRLLDPASRSWVQESGSSLFEGSFNALGGTATALSTSARIDFDAFYISADRKTEYAIGKYYWISGEIDQIALMREVSAESPAVSGMELSGEVSMDDFGWYFDGAFPMNGAQHRELQDFGGNWKSLICVRASSDGADIYRLVLSDAEIQYMGYKVTVLLHAKERYECPVADRTRLTTLETKDGIVMTFDGDWNEETAAIEAESINSTLAVRIHDYAETEGVQYALGTVMDGNAAIGEIVFVRQVNE